MHRRTKMSLRRLATWSRVEGILRTAPTVVFTFGCRNRLRTRRFTIRNNQELSGHRGKNACGIQRNPTRRAKSRAVTMAGASHAESDSECKETRKHGRRSFKAINRTNIHAT